MSFCPMRRQKSKDIQFKIILQWKKQQILVSEKLEPENVGCFSLKWPKPLVQIVDFDFAFID